MSQPLPWSYQDLFSQCILYLFSYKNIFHITSRQLYSQFIFIAAHTIYCPLRHEEYGFDYVRQDTISASEFQTYTLRDNHEDLTGMFVVADKPIIVIAAMSGTYDITQHGYQEPAAICLPPVESLGLQHILPPIAGRTELVGYYAHVVAAYDNTEVTTAPGLITTEVLIRGEHKME